MNEYMSFKKSQVVSRELNRFLWKLAQISTFSETLKSHFLINFFLQTFGAGSYFIF